MTTPRYTRAELLQTNAFQTVRRPGLAADLTPANTNLFNVAGVVLVSHCFGIVTTIIANAADCFLEIQTAIPVNTVPICGAHGGMDTDVPGTIYAWTGADGVGLNDTAVGALDVAAGATWAGGFIILTAGIINLSNTVPATGIIDWYITYLPMSLDGEITIL